MAARSGSTAASCSASCPDRSGSNVATPDPLNRIQCANNCVLARDGRHTVLDRYRLRRKVRAARPQVLCDGSGRAAVGRTGRVRRRARRDRHGRLQPFALRPRLRSDRGSMPHGRRVPLFPRATHSSAASEWEDATGGSPELATAYPMDDILPLYEAGLMMVVDDGSRNGAGPALQLDRRTHARTHGAVLRVGRPDGGVSRRHLSFDGAHAADVASGLRHLPARNAAAQTGTAGLAPPTKAGRSCGTTIHAWQSAEWRATRSANSCRSIRGRNSDGRGPRVHRETKLRMNWPADPPRAI